MRVRFAFPMVFALVFISVAIVMSAPAQVVTDGLVSYWTFDKATIAGGTVKDTWGSNDGTINGDPQTVGGKFGDALDLDGNDSIIFADDDSLKSDQYTIEAWLNFASAQPGLDAHGGWVISKELSMAGYGMAMCGQEPCSYHSDGTDWHRIRSNQEIGLGEWHHVAITYDETSVKVYVDGSMANSEDYGFANSTCPLGIGAWNVAGPSRYYTGLIDEARIYNRALSEAELTRNMSSEGVTAVSSEDKLALTWGKVKVSR